LENATARPLTGFSSYRIFATDNAKGCIEALLHVCKGIEDGSAMRCGRILGNQ
jgi:hypothetical protein